jgi:hypothetical protein
MKMIETPQCKCVETGEPVDCEGCYATIGDNMEFINVRGEQIGVSDRSYMSRTCSMIPMSIKETKCEKCGSVNKAPADTTPTCACKQIERRQIKRSPPKYLTCSCGQEIKIGSGDYDDDKTCYSCGKEWIKRNGEWKSVEMAPIDRDTMTLSNFVKVKKK